MALKNGWPVDRAPGRGKFIFDPAPEGSDGTGGGGGGGGGDDRPGLWDMPLDGDPSYINGLTGGGTGFGSGDGGGGGGPLIAVLTGSTLVHPAGYDRTYSGIPDSVGASLYGTSDPGLTQFTRTDLLDFVTESSPVDGALYRAASVENDFFIEDIFLHDPIFEGGTWLSRLVDFKWHTTAPTDFEHWATATNLTAVPSNYIITRKIIYENRELKFPNAGQWSTWDYAANGLIPEASGNNDTTHTFDEWGFGGRLVASTIAARYFNNWYKIFDFGAYQSQYINNYDFGPLGNYNDGIANRVVTFANNDSVLLAGDFGVYTADTILNPISDHTEQATQFMRLSYYHSNVVFKVDGVGRLTVYAPDDLLIEADPVKSFDVSTAWTAHGTLFQFDKKGLV